MLKFLICTTIRIKDLRGSVKLRQQGMQRRGDKVQALRCCELFKKLADSNEAIAEIPGDL